MVQTESAQRLLDGVDKSLTLHSRCLIRYWLWMIRGRPIKGSDVEIALELVGAGRNKVLRREQTDEKPIKIAH